MLRKTMVAVATFGVLAFASSCTKKGDTGPAGATGPAGPSYTGAISGHVDLYDQYGSKVLTGLSSVQVSLDGGSTQNATSAGYYMFSNVKTGSYTLSATNSGYGATQVTNFQFLSDTLNRDLKMSAIPNFSPATFDVYPTAAGTGDSLVMTFSTDTRLRNAIVFINSTSAVNGQPANYLLAYTKNIGANVPRAVIIIPKQDLINAGLASGATYYLAAYGYVISDASAYEDYSTGKTVYNAISSTPLTATAVVP